MAVLLNLLFLMVLLAIGFAIFCIPAILCWLAIDQLALRTFAKRVRIIVPFFAIPGTYVLLIAGISMWLTRPVAVYEMSFGFSPSQDVTIVSSSHSGIGDYGENDLTFTASKLTINKILSHKFKTRLEDSVPDRDGKYRFERKFSEIFASETSTLTYDPETTKAWYNWVGID